MDRVQARLKRARLRLYDSVPFFGYLVDEITFVESDTVPTAGITTAGNMYYNPEFIASLSTEETMGLLVHEVMHVAQLGHERKGNRDHKLWNIAQDIIINHIISKEDIPLPEGGYTPENGELTVGGIKFTDLDNHSFETVYGKLSSEQPSVPDDIGFDEHIISPTNEQGDQDSNNSNGQSNQQEPENPEDSESDGRTTDNDQMFDVTPRGNENEKDWNEIVQHAKAAATAREKSDGQGYSPGNAHEIVQASEPGTVDYRRYIKQKITNSIPCDYTYQKPNKRGRAIGVYLPSVKKKNKQSVTLAVLLDTSGSISTENLRQFAAEMVEIVKSFEDVEISLIQHDAKVQRVDHYEDPNKTDLETIEVAGRGGTRHIEPVNYIVDNEDDIDPDLIVGYTDAESTFHEESPIEVPFLWVLTPDTSVTTDSLPFGAVSRLD